MRFGEIVIVYFLIAGTMWAGGAIDYSQADPVGFFLEKSPEAVAPNEDTVNSIGKMSGPIKTALQSVGGGALLAVVDIIFKFIGLLFWPVTVLLMVNAPLSVVVLLGGANVAGLFGGVIRIIRGSA